MSAVDLLDQVEAQRVVFKAEGDRLLFAPRNAVEPKTLSALRASKTEILALVKVKDALQAAGQLTASELKRLTGLGTDQLYGALGDLYERRELATDIDGHYWLPDTWEN